MYWNRWTNNCDLTNDSATHIVSLYAVGICLYQFGREKDCVYVIVSRLISSTLHQKQGLVMVVTSLAGSLWQTNLQEPCRLSLANKFTGALQAFFGKQIYKSLGDFQLN